MRTKSRLFAIEIDANYAVLDQDDVSFLESSLIRLSVPRGRRPPLIYGDSIGSGKSGGSPSEEGVTGSDGNGWLSEAGVSSEAGGSFKSLFILSISIEGING